MLKHFQQVIAGGDTSDYWDANWDTLGTANELVDNDRTCENQPIWPLLAETIHPKKLFLEGGCGPGHWVRYFHSRGYRAVGIDFAQRTVQRLQRIAPELDVRLGNILHLPFGDGEVHTYYSGGVVEHFEDGPERALAEARRVVASDGWFLCSVPDANTLRERILYRSGERRQEHRHPPRVVRRVQRTEPETPPERMQFVEYIFRESEFRARLANAGFRIERTFSYNLIWGLMDIPGIEPLYRRTFDGAGRIQCSPLRTASVPKSGLEESRMGKTLQRGRVPKGIRGLLQRVLVQEDDTVPILGRIVGITKEHMANMRMYVTRPSP